MKVYFSRKRTYLLTLVIILATATVLPKSGSQGRIMLRPEAMLYNELGLAQLGLKPEVFIAGLNGWKSLLERQCVNNTNLLSIADLSQSSNAKRLYVIDMARRKVLFNTYVSHGRNSGDEFAHSFSNKPETYKSSLGFFLTDNIYRGMHGLSMKLKGLENGINDIAEQRGIVMHGASYVSNEFIEKFGRLGRSLGCPAVPEDLCYPIVNSIKDGSCLFVYYPDSSYFRNSEFF